MRGHALSPVIKVHAPTYNSTIKHARLNSTILLSKYEDMLDALDLNSVAKARKINSQFIVTAHMEL